MKRKLLFPITCLILFSCTSDLTNESGKKELSNLDAEFAVFPYLELHGEEYLLDLSKEEALNLGVSESDYLRFLNEISIANEKIALIMRTPDRAYFKLENPKKTNVKKLKERLESHNVNTLKTRSETGFEGAYLTRISTNSQYPGYSSVYIPSGGSSIEVVCASSGLIQVFNYSVTTCGNTASGGGTGWFGSHIGTLNPNCTGTQGEFSFSTANSNGGSATFKIKKL